MNNEPAFPCDAIHVPGGVINSVGMRLRDYFAAKAMQGLLSDPNRKGSWDAYSEDAYRMADAMLAAREVK